LSGREREVLIGICSGKTNKEIARDLELQEVTVKMHVRSLTAKLEAKNRTHAAMIARDSLIV
jgi:two-component system nitrate/nitrite response regulator NarL